MKWLLMLYANLGAPYPRMTTVAAALIGAIAFGGAWWLIGKEYEKQLAAVQSSSIAGRWHLRRESGTAKEPEKTWMRIKMEGTRLNVTGSGVLGNEWNGQGTFDGKKGYYDWEFKDGKMGSTQIHLDTEGILWGEVQGSGIDWGYWATKQIE